MGHLVRGLRWRGWKGSRQRQWPRPELLHHHEVHCVRWLVHLPSRIFLRLLGVQPLRRCSLELDLQLGRLRQQDCLLPCHLVLRQSRHCHEDEVSAQNKELTFSCELCQCGPLLFRIGPCPRGKRLTVCKHFNRQPLQTLSLWSSS